MSAAEHFDSDSPVPAEEIYREFLRRREQGEDIAFEAFCREHEPLAPALEALHSMHVAGGGPTVDSEGDSVGLGGLVEDAPTTIDADSRIGSEIGPYRLEEVIGEGGFGRVFRARQLRPVKRRVALKIIKAGMDTREVIARFEAERQALAYMDHPGIARVFDFGATRNGRPYFVMEYVDGEPITRHCDAERLSIADRLRLFLGVCEAVQHAHQKAIIHRDLKPSNVMVVTVDGRAQPKVIDFGIAKATADRLTESTLATRAGEIVGTPAYMSPEQAGGDTRGIDTRTDIYSLGVILYELLVGKLPLGPDTFAGAGVGRIAELIREHEPLRPSVKVLRDGDPAAAACRGESPRGLSRRLRGDLDWIVSKALAKERDRRYSSVSELAADIQRHLDHVPVSAGPPSRSYILLKALRKHRRAVAIVATIVVTAGVFGVATRLYSSWRFRESRAGEAASEYRTGSGAFEEYLSAREEARDLEGRVDAFSHPPWLPRWERTDELAARRELDTRRRAAAERLAAALLSLERAHKIVPAPSDLEQTIRQRLAEVSFHRYLLSRAGETASLGPAYFEDKIRSLGVDDYDREFLGRGVVSWQTEPRHARLWCFRYELRDGHLVPLPFRPTGEGVLPAEGLLARPRLVVEQVWDPRVSLQPGDRVVTVGGQPVATRSELGELLRGVEEDHSVPVVVERGERRVELGWVPFPAEPDEHLAARLANPQCPYRPGRLVNIFDQLRVGFTGYPLVFVDGAMVGSPGAAGRLDVELPRGSYLFVLRAPGYLDARVPVRVPGPAATRRVRLLRESDVPAGFVHVPGGPAEVGGDTGAFQPLQRREVELPTFFIGRFEITAGEYLRFLNDPQVFARTGEDGRAAPRSPWVIERLRGMSGAVEGDVRVQLVPRRKNLATLLPRDEEAGRWRLPDSPVRWLPSWPATAIGHLAAREYIHWRNETEEGPWRYRLPTDEEWEKAARGVDRRIYVWGDELDWTYCWNYNAFFQSPSPGPVGVMPLDESVFGVRDVAGSVTEHTSGIARRTSSTDYFSLRGGSWQVPDRQYYRLATRNGLAASGIHVYAGFRLVAEPR